MKKIDDLIFKIKEISSKKKLASGFTIGNTSKDYKGEYYTTPVRVTSKLVTAGVIVYSEKSASKILKKIDGKVNYILVDSEKKIPKKLSISGISANIERKAREIVKKSELFFYKGNDLALDAIDIFLTHITKHELRGLGNKKIAIIGGGNLGSKLALTLVERGANVFLTRRNKAKLKAIVKALNIIKPLNTNAEVRGLTNNVKASYKADILIAANQGEKVITENIVKNLKNNSIIFDAGRGTISDKALTLALNRRINVYRVDINSSFEGLISKLFFIDKVIKNGFGRRVLLGERIVSGGLLAKKNEFVVDNIFKPKFFYGIGDGHGDFLRKIDSENSIFKRAKEFKKRLNLT